jgi:mannitol/fructose-specific phosphotransferase system IIA component (Ntr-type)
MEHGIALPHGVTDAIAEDIGCLGVSRAGIPYETFDGEPVHIIFLLLTPATRSLWRVRILSRIARLLNCHDRRQRICDAGNEAEVLQVIREGDVEAGDLLT